MHFLHYRLESEVLGQRQKIQRVQSQRTKQKVHLVGAVLLTPPHRMEPADAVRFLQILATISASWSQAATPVVPTTCSPMAMRSSSSLTPRSTRTTSSGARATTLQVSRSSTRLDFQFAKYLYLQKKRGAISSFFISITRIWKKSEVC